jgi:hypothetical protein
VTDSNGAIIPGAKITVTNTGTNKSVTVVATDDGIFSISSLEPVVYSVSAEAANFKKTVVSNVKVDTASIQTVNVVLEAGNIAETVNIDSSGELINTESGTAGSTITERQLRELPLNNRSVLDLAVTVSNVSGDAGSEDAEVTAGQPVPGFNLSLTGGRPGGGSILADGVNNTGVGIGRAVVSFTPETVQEFTVQTSAYSAEYGNTSGGVINATTKSGKNDFFGTALWYHRNPKTNAQPYRIGTTPRTPNNLRYNQASLTLGGPVYFLGFNEGGPTIYDGHDKTFFFFAYEPRWRNDFVTTTTLLPTEAERNGDFRGLVRSTSGWLPASVAAQFGISPSGTGPAAIFQQFTMVNGRLVPITLTGTQQYCQFGAVSTLLTTVTMTPSGPVCTASAAPGGTAIGSDPNLNVLPSQFIDPVARRLLAFMPQGGNYFLDNGLVRNYVVNREVTQNETRYTIRLDHSVTKANKVNFRYTTTPAIAIRDFGTDINGNTGVYSNAKQILIGDDHVFSAHVVNNLRLNYTRGVFSEDFSPEFSVNGGRNLSNELGLPSLTSGGLPLFQISGDSGNGYNAFADVGSSGSTNNFNKEERYNFNDVVYWTKGGMTWKIGTDLSNAKLNVKPFFGASGGRWEFRTLNTSSNRSTNLPNGGNNLASLLIGVPNAVQVRPSLLDYNYTWKSAAFFVQNDWKIKRNLTLNLGMRYSLQLPREEKNNLQGVFRPDLAETVTLTEAQRRATATGLGLLTTDPIPSYVPTTVKIPVFAFAGRGGRSKYLVPIDYMDFEPRFGFAWSPKIFKWAEDRNTVIRGGYGISHAPLTGNNRLPSPDFGGFQAVSTTATGSTVGGTADPTQPVRLNGNYPVINGGSLDQVLGINADGIVGLNSIGIVGFATAGPDAGAIPYVQNWNLSTSFELFKNLAVEFAYVGAKGTHLFMPLVNINPRDTNFVETLEGSNINAETAFNDPLGRRNALGAIVTIQRNSIVSPYFGFNTLNRYIDPSAISIRHAGYVEVRKRLSNGLDFTANYTYGKSIDDASDASPDVRVLTTGTTLGQVYYGATRTGDRAISAFDIKHNFNSTFVWDLPFGKTRQLMKNAPGIVDAIIGGWTMSGVFRLQGGQPYTPFITDTNRLGGVNRSVRMNVVEGVPLKNPLWSRDCPIGAGCEPYLNPAAFMRPPKGSLGNSSRTVDLRSPTQQYFDLSVQKSFKLPFIGGKDGRRKINFRVDLLNALNQPVFRYNNTGNTPFGFGTLPTETPVTLAEYNAWAAFNGKPAATGAGDPALIAVQNLVINNRLPSGALPLNFFSVPVPQGFATRNALSFDITQLGDYRLYRLRQNYDANFGTLFSPVTNPRYIQFGVRVFF